MIGKQEYSGNTPTAKILMTDSIPVCGTLKQRSEPADPTNVAFLETKYKYRWYPSCYCCGEQYTGGYTKYSIMTKAVWERTVKAVGVGHF